MTDNSSFFSAVGEKVTHMHHFWIFLKPSMTQFLVCVVEGWEWRSRWEFQSLPGDSPRVN